MSTPTKKTGPKQILTKEFIYKIVLLEVVGFSLILPAQSSTGEFFTDSQTFQSGPAQCTLVNVPSGQEVPGCQATITFPKAFSSVPTKYGISTQCMSNGVQNLAGKTADQVCQALGAQQGHSFTSIFVSYTFQSDNGETWTSMPAIKTEIYGNPNHEIMVANSGVAQTAIFSANCMTGSTGASAVLRPEFLSPSGWFQVAAVNGLLDLSVSSTSSFLCGSGSGSQIISTAANVNITISNLLPPIPFRVVGIGGSGIGDNPVFNNIKIELTQNIPLSISVNIGTLFGNVQSVTTTTMGFYATAITPGNSLGTLNPIFSWWTCVC